MRLRQRLNQSQGEHDGFGSYSIMFDQAVLAPAVEERDRELR
jgi:hypothetical protein